MRIFEGRAGNSEKQTKRGNRRENVAGQFGLREAEKEDWEDCPARNEEAGGIAPGIFTPETESLLRNGNHQSGPRKECKQEHGAKKPERLFMLENWSEVALEIVLEEKGMEEIRVAALANDVPRQGDDTKSRDCQR